MRSTLALKTLASLAISASLTFVPTPSASAAPLDEVPVITGAPDQFGPAANQEWLAWTQQRRNTWNAFVRPLDGSLPRERINRFHLRSFGYLGGFDPSAPQVLFQEVWIESNLLFYQLGAGSYDPPPRGINTRLWEWGPDLSSSFILFGRNKFQEPSSPWKIMLFDRGTRQLTMLDSATNRCRCIWPGTVSDRYATWTKCTGGLCHVWMHDTQTDTSSRVPNPLSTHQFNATVSPDGDLYFLRGGDRCGQNVELWRWTIGSPIDSAVLVHAFDPGTDTKGRTYLVEDAGGHDDVYFDAASCSDRDFRGNIYVVEDADTATPVAVVIAASSGSAPSRLPAAASPSGEQD